MRKIIVIILSIILISCSKNDSEKLQQALLLKQPYPIEPYRIMLDPGHGGLDSGSSGLVIEKEVTYTTAIKLRSLLDSNPHFYTMMTRYGDNYVNLTSRKAFGDEFNIDLFFSIHANSNEELSPNINGFQIFVNNKDNLHYKQSYQLATLIKENFISEGYNPFRETGIFYTHYVEIGTDSNNDPKYQKENLSEWEEDNYNITGDSYRVLTSNKYPSILIEQGYVTSETDVLNWLNESGSEKAAILYYHAICDYYQVDY